MDLSNQSIHSYAIADLITLPKIQAKNKEKQNKKQSSVIKENVVKEWKNFSFFSPMQM